MRTRFACLHNRYEFDRSSCEQRRSQAVPVCRCVIAHDLLINVRNLRGVPARLSAHRRTSLRAAALFVMNHLRN